MESAHPQPAARPGLSNDHGSQVDAQSTDALPVFKNEGTKPTWKGTAGRIYGTLFRTRRGATEVITTINTSNVAAGTMSDDTSRTASLPVTSNGNDSSAPSSGPTASSYRRRYIDIWIRYRTKSTTSSSSSSTPPAPPSKIRDAYRTALKDKVVRTHITVSAVTGLIMLSLISLYLVYSLNFTSISGPTYHIFFISLIIIFAMVFIHSFARACLIAAKVAKYGSTGAHRVPSVVGPLGYAQPDHPIHVILARDEEIAIEGEELDQMNHHHDSDGNSSADDSSSASADNSAAKNTLKPVPPPPAYGLWRSSVRINPNLIYWQRVEASKTDANNSTNNGSLNKISEGQSASTTTTTSTTTTAAASNTLRPPSYASEDGVEYVVQAQPRSTVTYA